MSIFSVALKTALGFAGLGFVCGVLYAVGGFFYDLFTTGLNAGTALAFLALLGMPLAFGLAGFGLGVVGALLAAVLRGVRR